MFEFDTVESTKPKAEQLKMSFTRDEIAWIDEQVNQQKVKTRQDFVRMCITHFKENG